MSNVEKIVNGITEYTDNKFDVELLDGFAKKPSEEAVSVEEIIYDDVDEFIDYANLNALFDLDDKLTQMKLLRKIMYIMYLGGLGEDQTTMTIKGVLKMMKNKM